MIEQQTGILEEQPTLSKKQVTEAKTSVNSMRSGMGTIVGFISSLEAQLKTPHEIAYSNSEDESSIATAKDLNLVNSSQVELNQDPRTNSEETSCCSCRTEMALSR